MAAGFIGNSVILMPMASYIALAIAAIGGTLLQPPQLHGLRMDAADLELLRSALQSWANPKKWAFCSRAG